MPRRFTLVALGAAILFGAPTQGQMVSEQVDLGVAQQIRAEGLNRSHLDTLARYITDVIGPRLTNSPANRRANTWAAEVLRGWGLTKVAVEPWTTEFGRGWERQAVYAAVVEPYSATLVTDVQAWSGSTRGRVTCPVVALAIRDTMELEALGSTMRGACVLRAPENPTGPEFEARDRRIDADALFAPVEQAGRGGRSPEQLAEFRAAQGINEAVGRFLRAHPPAVTLQPSGWSYNILLTGGHPDGRTARDSVYNPVPALVVSKEQYNRLWRNAVRGVAQRMEVEVRTTFIDGDRMGANVLGEIRGTDKADQVVMLGAHYDSWHSGTGATDNAAGSVVMMEAIRILKTLNLPMRRTVRIGLWSGEEQGLLGSRDWVRTHAAELPNISAYVNVDNGTGKIRGLWNQSNTAATPIFEQILFAMRDLGVLAVRNGNTGGTDHLAFDAAGVPGFNFIQDPIEYSTRTHHSNVDVYDQLVIEDLRQAATVVAWTVYTLANREDLMPRKAAPGT